MTVKWIESILVSQSPRMMIHLHSRH